MSNFTVCLNAVLPIFLLLALGYLTRLLGLLDRDLVERLNRAMFRVFLPVLMFYNLYRSDLASAIRPKLILFATLGLLAVFTLSSLIARRFVRVPAQRGVVIQGLYRSNFVLIGLPLAASLVGEQNVGSSAVLMAVVVPLYNVLAVIVLSVNSGEKPSVRRLLLDVMKNPLILGTVAGVLVLLLGLKLPAPLETVASQVTQTASAMLLILLGAFFEFGGLRRFRRMLIWVAAGRLLFFPAVLLGLAAALGFRGPDFAALIGMSASCTAAASFTMAQQMGGDAELAGDIVVVTSALCPLTLFFWCYLFKTLNVF